jgi:cellobiose-specific phosphotransferase system component IIA
VLGALVGQNPKWITNLVSFAGDASSTLYATFKLVQPDSLKPATQKVAKVALTNVRSDSHEGW